MSIGNLPMTEWKIEKWRITFLYLAKCRVRKLGNGETAWETIISSSTNCLSFRFTIRMAQNFLYIQQINLDKFYPLLVIWLHPIPCKLCSISPHFAAINSAFSALFQWRLGSFGIEVSITMTMKLKNALKEKLNEERLRNREWWQWKVRETWERQKDREREA